MSRDQRTEKPTPRRLREARREGRLPRSPEIGSYVALLAATWLLPLTVRSATGKAQELFAALPAVITRPDVTTALHLLRQTLIAGMTAAAPLVLGMLLIGLAASSAQGGVHLATKAARPKLSRLNPLKGFRKIFGASGAIEAVKALVRAAVIGLIGWRSVQHVVTDLTSHGSLSLDAAVGTTVTTILQLARWTAVTGLVLAAADYAIKRRQVMRTLRMTKQEVREEHRQSEGDPQLRSAIRSRQMSLSRNRMMREVASADVVVVNPTHVAVALRYRPGDAAPVVVARGAGVVAARIRREAEEHRVPMVSDVPLARTIYKMCRVGDPVPADLYEAVARVLAFVYALRARARGRRGVAGPLPMYRPAA